MPELRFDPVAGRPVVIAEERAGRPNDFTEHQPPFCQKETGSHQPHVDRRSDHEAGCPFCAGHEQQTPQSLLEVPDGKGSWQVRVIPNKYPAVTPDVYPQPDAGGSDKRNAIGQSPLDGYQQVAFGAHEVIIESPRHLHDVTQLSVAELDLVLAASRERLRYWSRDGRMRHAILFKNSGFAAGASIEHVHSQLMVLPEVPVSVQQELDGASRYWHEQRRCIYCDLVRQELEYRKRLVLENDSWIAFCAYAGRLPCETWLLPKSHQACFEGLSDSQISGLATVLHQLLVQLNLCIPGVSYNLVLHTAPFDGSHGERPISRNAVEVDCYHWHWELIPRTSELAGLELGAGIYINSLSPERAAQFLRNAGDNSSIGGKS